MNKPKRRATSIPTMKQAKARMGNSRHVEQVFDRTRRRQWCLELARALGTFGEEPITTLSRAAAFEKWILGGKS